MTCRGFRIGNFTTSADFDELRSDELRVDMGLAVFEKHFEDFAKVSVQLVERLSLRVSAGEPWNEANVQARIRTSLNDRRKRSPHRS